MEQVVEPPKKRSRVDSPTEQWTAEPFNAERFTLNVGIFNQVIEEFDQMLWRKRLYLSQPVRLHWLTWTDTLVRALDAKNTLMVPMGSWLTHVRRIDFQHEVLLVLQDSGYEAYFYLEEDKNKGSGDWLSIRAAAPIKA
jgi:hypothetical protein